VQKGVKWTENCGVCVDKRRAEKRGEAMAKKVQAEDKDDIGSVKQGASEGPRKLTQMLSKNRGFQGSKSAISFWNRVF